MATSAGILHPRQRNIPDKGASPLMEKLFVPGEVTLLMQKCTEAAAGGAVACPTSRAQHLTDGSGAPSPSGCRIPSSLQHAAGPGVGFGMLPAWLIAQREDCPRTARAGLAGHHEIIPTSDPLPLFPMCAHQTVVSPRGSAAWPKV